MSTRSIDELKGNARKKRTIEDLGTWRSVVRTGRRGKEEGKCTFLSNSALLRRASCALTRRNQWTVRRVRGSDVRALQSGQERGKGEKAERTFDASVFSCNFIGDFSRSFEGSCRVVLDANISTIHLTNICNQSLLLVNAPPSDPPRLHGDNE